MSYIPTLQVTSKRVWQSKQEVLYVKRDGTVPDALLKQELVVIARTNFDYPEATAKDVKKVKIGDRKLFVLILAEEASGIRDMPRENEVVIPVDTFLVETNGQEA